MPVTRAEFPTVMCQTLSEAFTKAAEAAAYNHGQVTTGLLYGQGTLHGLSVQAWKPVF